MLRVAAVVEQSWHSVPGGTAAATNAQLAAVAALVDAPELVGVAAAHRLPPPDDFAPPIPVRHLRLPRRALYAAWLGVRRPRVESATGPVDVIHATSAAVPPRSAPLVVTVHDLAFMHFPHHATRVGQRFFERSWALVEDEADLVLCPSQATADDCVAHGLSADRIQVVPWGVDNTRAGPAEISEVRSRLGLPAEFVLFVGTVEPRKNLRRLIDAMEALGPSAPPLVVAGPAGWNEDVATLTASLGDRIRLLGRVAAADLAPLYAAATVFAWPSLLEGFGLPVLEAMAQGAAVVTSLGTSTEELANGAGRCVDPTSVDAIAGAIGDLLEAPHERERLGELARARAQEFTWKRTAVATVAAYRQAAS